MAASHSSITETRPLIGIVCALHLEIAPFLKRCRKLKTQSGNGFTFRGCRLHDVNICVVEGGTGAQRAAQATQALIDAFHPEWMLSVGFSGAIQPSIRTGEIVVATEVLNSLSGKSLNIDVRMSSSPGIHLGRIATVEQIVRLVEEKKELAARTGAVAVDMESWGVANACHAQRTKFMAIRCISDDLSEDLPQEVLAILGPKGTVRAGALAASILQRPGSIKDFWALRERSILAAERMAEFLDFVIAELAPRPD